MIEKPARRVLNQPRKQYVSFFIFGSITLAIVWACLYIRINNHVSAENWQVRSGGITINDQIKKSCITLMGDSNASMYGNSLRVLASKLNIKAHIISVDAGNPLPNSELYESSIEAIKNTKPDYVIFVASWSSKIDSEDKRKKLLLALHEISGYAGYIILITQPPILPEQGTRSYIRNYGIKKAIEEYNNYISRNYANSYIKSLASDNIIAIDINDAFSLGGREIQFLDSNGNFLFQDAGHLSGLGASIIINDYLAPMLARHADQNLTCASSRPHTAHVAR